MEILVVGSSSQEAEVKQKFGQSHSYARSKDHSEAVNLLKNDLVVFDFIASEYKHLIFYNKFSLTVFIDTSFVSLSELNVPKSDTSFFGFSGMPTFLNREILEVSVSDQRQVSALNQVCAQLGTPHQMVADKVGLVTPRVICMIINEAYYTLEEGTATREDIDKAMKLGTNYPWGPFEWCNKIGGKNVCRLLDAMYKGTADSRYKVCNAMRNAQ